MVPRLTIAPHYDESALRSQLQSQNDGLNGGILLSDDRFPALGTDFSQNDVFRTADRWFQNGHWVIKMAHCCV